MNKINFIQAVIYIALNVLMMIFFISMIIKYYTGFSEYEYIWFCSKILTMEKIIKKNNEKDQIFSHISQSKKYYFNKVHYLDFLNISRKEGCAKYYKKCGILDTYGNNFCLPEEDDCPMNEMIFDSTSKLSEYQEKDYLYYITDAPDLNFYYKYGVKDKGIVVKWVFEDTQPKYIDDYNFVFDEDAFYEWFGKPDDKKNNDDDDDDDDDDDNSLGAEIISGSISFAGDLIESAAKLAKINKLLAYIEDKINKDENNIDYNFTYINNGQYVKNFLGFENMEAAEDFGKINFSLYKSRYPNYASVVSSIV